MHEFKANITRPIHSPDENVSMIVALPELKPQTRQASITSALPLIKWR